MYFDWELHVASGRALLICRTFSPLVLLYLSEYRVARQTLIYAFDKGMTDGDYAFVMLQLEQEQFIRNIKRPAQIFVLLNLPAERQCDYNQALESVILVEINSTVDQKAYEAFEEEVEQNFPRFSPGLSKERQVSALLYKAVASWLVRSSPDRAVRIRAGWLGTLCCVLGQDTSLSRCLSPPRFLNEYRQR